MSSSYPRRALVSVSDKTELGPFVRGLVELGFEILSTGGTRRFLDELGIDVIDVSTYTGFPEIFDGRVKTLHPKIHGAILGRPDQEKDQAAIREHGIVPFELVVCNLYPFEKTIQQEGVTLPEAIEQIDIGGPSMIRSAAKNHAYVAVISRPSQYAGVLGELQAGALNESTRRALAAAAFEMTARYDRAIADYLASAADVETTAPETAGEQDRWPRLLSLRFQRKDVLRYGENPHQQAAFYVDADAAPGTLAATEQLHGKPLSYNNLLDLNSALAIVREQSDPCAVVIKHNNPCGCAIGETLSAAFDGAYEGDPQSAFGSVIGLNRPLDLATAEQLCLANRFIEAILAPGFEEEAFEALTTRPKWKNNVRLMRCGALGSESSGGSDFRPVAGGLLAQDIDEGPDAPESWKSVTEREPTPTQRRDLEFAWSVCRHVKSNAIVLAKGGALVGVGAGQMSRVDAAFIAAHKAGDRSQGAVVASDAFFPFRDGVDEVAKTGITAIIQPGGSRGDDEVIKACNEQGLAMVFTSRRHFKH